MHVTGQIITVVIWYIQNSGSETWFPNGARNNRNICVVHISHRIQEGFTHILTKHFTFYGNILLEIFDWDIVSFISSGQRADWTSAFGKPFAVSIMADMCKYNHGTYAFAIY